MSNTEIAEAARSQVLAGIAEAARRLGADPQQWVSATKVLWATEGGAPEVVSGR